MAAFLMGATVWQPEAVAANTSQLKEKKASIEAQRKQARVKRYENLKRAKYHEDRLISKQIELSKTQRQLNQQEEILESTEKSLEKLEKELDVTIGEATRLSQVIGARIRDWYKGGRVTLLQQILSAQSLTQMVDRIYFQELIIKQDARLFRELRKKTELLKQKQATLLEEKKALAEAVAQIQGLKTTLNVQLQQEQRLKNKYRNDARYYQQLEQKLLAESYRIENMLRGDYGAVRQSTGQMQYPVSGRISSGFGYRVHPIHRSRTLHTGIDFAKPTGTPVHAADGGKVVYAGWRGGYGRCIIINHGKGLATLYAHLSRTYVGTGAYVGKGQSIGAIGTTGYSTGPHLHFEVRRNGRPVNPMSYL